MIKSFSIPNEDLGSNIFPNYYLFKQKIKNYSTRKDIKSFSLGDKGVLEVLTDGEHAGQKFVDNGALFIKNSSVKRYGISEFDGFYISHEKNESLKRSMLQKDDVLLTTIGYYLGVSAVVNSNVQNANINQNLVRIRINREYTTPQYLSAYLNSKLVRFQIDNLFTGTYPILTYPKIKSIKVFIKSKEVEKKVTDSYILAEEKNIQSLNLIKKAKEIFLKELNIDYSQINKEKFFCVNGSQLLNEDIMTPAYYNPLYVQTTKQLSSKHHCEYLRDIADFKNGDEVGSINYKTYNSRKETDIPFIRTSDIINYDFDTYPDFYIDRSIYLDLNQDISENEILFTKDGKIGITAMTTSFDKCILGSGILRIKAKKEKINPFYLFIALSTKEVGLFQAIQRTVVASTLPHLREDRVGDFQIPIISKQEKIIELTETAFRLRDERKILINEIRLLIENSLEY